jgi:hypothetical protein
VVSFDAAFPTQPHVIPAKAGIQSLTSRLPKLCEVDSRFRGNDVRSGAPYRANDTTTRTCACPRGPYEGAIGEIKLFDKYFYVVPAKPEDGHPVEFYQAIINDPRRGCGPHH